MNWITHTGTACPVDPAARVVYLLDGDDTERHDRAGQLYWGREFGGVAKYRVIDPPPGIGDVNSSTKGSGARFNGNKPDLSLIPAGIVARYAQGIAEFVREAGAPTDWPEVLASLGYFQMRQGEPREWLHRALYLMDGDGEMWAECARVFEYGRAKYSRREDCTCSAGNAARQKMESSFSTKESREEYAAFANAATTKTSRHETPTTKSARSPTVESGLKTPPIKNGIEATNANGTRSDATTPHTASSHANAGSCPNTGSPSINTSAWLREVAGSAAQANDLTSTTATRAARSGEYSAIPATLALDFSNGLTAGLNAHSPTCGVQRTPGMTGSWNWSKGMAWSIPVGCAMRHIVFGTMKGEHLDPESGRPHRGHIACNLVMSLWFLDTFPEGDDLYRPPVSA